jgi:hypothetical protein
MDSRAGIFETGATPGRETKARKARENLSNFEFLETVHYV